MRNPDRSSTSCRIAFVSTMSGVPWGGSEELWTQAARRLQARGHEVSASVIWWPHLAPQILSLQKSGVELWAPAPQGATLAGRVLRKVESVCGLASREVAWLRRKKPDLVVISQGYCQDGVAWMRLCIELGLPFVTIVHCNADGLWPADESSRRMADVYRAAKRVFCISRHNLELLECQIGESLPNAQIVWNPFNVPATGPSPWPATAGMWRFACVGRLDPGAKGQDLLFHALARPQWPERPVEINLYGSGPCENTLRRLMAKLRLRNVHFRGHTSNVQAIWEQNHMLVLPSRYEGLPLALVEAMWCGRPAVVTDIGGNAELCVDGQTGFVAAAPAAGLVADALERAWNGRDRWPHLGAAGAARVRSLLPEDPVGDFCGQLEVSLATTVDRMGRTPATTTAAVEVERLA